MNNDFDLVKKEVEAGVIIIDKDSKNPKMIRMSDEIQKSTRKTIKRFEKMHEILQDLIEHENRQT